MGRAWLEEKQPGRTKTCVVCEQAPRAGCCAGRLPCPEPGCCHPPKAKATDVSQKPLAHVKLPAQKAKPCEISTVHK